MNNRHEARGDVTAIILRRKSGPPVEALIDTSDLPKAQSISGSWSAGYFKFEGVHRVVGWDHVLKLVHLSRFLMDPPPGLVVDHINHDPLDNRRANLRVVTRSENGLNRRGPRRDLAAQYSSPKGGAWACR